MLNDMPGNLSAEERQRVSHLRDRQTIRLLKACLADHRSGAYPLTDERITALIARLEDRMGEWQAVDTVVPPAGYSVYGYPEDDPDDEADEPPVAAEHEGARA